MLIYEVNGCGTVFTMTTEGTLTTLPSFENGTDGGFPTAGLLKPPTDTFTGQRGIQPSK